LSLLVERRDPVSWGWAASRFEALAPWLAAVGPVALVELASGGSSARLAGEIGELGLVLLDPGEPTFAAAVFRLAPDGATPAALAAANRADALADLRDLLRGRAVAAFEAERLRGFLARAVDPSFAHRTLLDLQALFALGHPDAPDLELDTLAGLLLAIPAGERPRARPVERPLERAVVAGRLLAEVAHGAASGLARYAALARILAERLPGSPWTSLVAGFVTPGAPPLPTPALFDVDLDVDPDVHSASRSDFDFARFAQRAFAESRRAGDDATGRSSPLSSPSPSPSSELEIEPESGPAPEAEERYLAIGASEEAPVPFEMGAIVAALSDEERGRRHFPGYRVRKEQIELARQFVHVLQDGGVAKLEGGTGVGKSLAYLAAVIPFAMARASGGGAGRGRDREPVVLSTRTKLLQDQLLHKDIAAAARFLGHPGLRALSIKGRANYVCERRLAAVLADGGDPAMRRELQEDFALLEACARIRPAGEVGTVPAALLERRPRLRELLRASVAARADQCSREQCGHEKRCPFGRHRKALAKAHLVVANHDLLLRWPPDYPAFAHVIADEGHELGGVAEEVYSIRVRPEEIEERLDALFGHPARRGARRFATHGLVARAATRSAAALVDGNRDDLRLELAGLGSSMAAFADAWGGAELPAEAGRARPAAARLAASAATRLEALANHALREGPARRFESGATAAGEPLAGLRDHAAEEEAQRSIASHAEALLGAANGLRMAFAVENDAYVGAFEGLENPYDRWSLVLRPVDPGPAFHEEFLARVESLAVVSATLFVGGDDHAALGDVGLADTGTAIHFSYSVPSPFPYAQAMRVVALDGRDGLVEDTAEALAILAKRLGGRTLGLFTSLSRMREVAERLTALLSGEEIEILVPLRASDDPGGLVDRFRKLRGAAVVLGSRRYWQGIDVRGDDLQAVVIEKLPFEVPTELRRRRDLRLRAAGEDPFARAALGHMLLHLKQMVGRLIRSETDRGIVVIVDARTGRSYFRRLADALPDGVDVEHAALADLPRIVGELGLGPNSS